MKKVPGIAQVRVTLKDGLTVLDFEPDNAVTLGPGNTISVRETPPDYYLVSFSISEDGRLLAMGWESGRVEVWELQAKKRVAEFPCGVGNPLTMKFNPGGTQLVVAGPKGKIAFLELPVGRKLREVKIEMGKRKYDIQELVLDRDGKWLAYANEDNGKVLDLGSKAPVTLAALGEAQGIALSQDGTELWAVDRKVLQRFSTSSWKDAGHWPLKSEPYGSRVVVRTGIDDDGRPIVAVPSKKGLVFYQAPDMQGRYVTDKGNRGVEFLRGRKIFINLSENLSFLNASGTFICERAYEGMEEAGYEVSQDGQWLAMARSGNVDLWHVEDLLSDCSAGQ